MITPSQAKRIEVFCRAVTVAEHPVGEATPELVHQVLSDLDGDRTLTRDWAYAMTIEIGETRETAQLYAAAVMTTERSLEALGEALSTFWLKLRGEGVF